jgi:hypothetical protein
MRRLAILLLVLATLLGPGAASAVPPDGTMALGLHVTLVSRWLDPGETEALITPFMVLYALHDALVKPMPGNIMTPSLAESWTVSKDGLTYEFVIRKNARFHNGDPVTARRREVHVRAVQGRGRQAAQGQGEGGPGGGAQPGPLRAEGAVARLHGLLRHLRHRRGLDRAQEVHREGGRGGLQEGPGRRGPLQVRLVHPRRRADPRGLRRLLAQGSVREAPGHSARSPTRPRARPR